MSSLACRDVDRTRVSRNVCDALERVTPETFARAGDGTVEVTFDLWPTAHRFARGHRIRLQVSSGAHPRYARNPGTGEPIATATRLVAADQEVLHDSRHPSEVVLSVVPARASVRARTPDRVGAARRPRRPYRKFWGCLQGAENGLIAVFKPPSTFLRTPVATAHLAPEKRTQS